MGKLAEKYFNIWSTEADFIINQSLEDEAGWDFLVENSDIQKSSVEDIHKPQVQYFFQVKSTNGRKRNTDIHLENLYRLAKSPIPCFYILLVFDTKLKPSKLYIKHVDKEIILKVLMRVAKSIKDEEFDLLHKKTINIKFEESACIKVLSGEKIRDFIEKTVGSDYSLYLKEKQNILENSGYEDGFGNFNLGFEDVNDIVDFTHLYLGMKKSIQLKKGSLALKRFGNIFKNISADDAKLEISPPIPNHIGVLYLFKEELPTSIFFKVKHYILDFNHLLDDKFKLNRIESKYFDILYNPTNQVARIIPNFNNDSELDILQFINYAHLFNELQIASSIEAKLFVENKSIFTLTPREQVETPILLIDIPLLENLARILVYFPCLNDVKPTLKQLYDLKDKIDLTDKILTMLPFDITANLLPNELIDMNDYYMYIDISLAFGTSTIRLICVLTGTVQLTKLNGFKFAIKNIEIIRDFSFLDTFPLISEAIQKIKSDIISRYTDLSMIEYIID